MKWHKYPDVIPDTESDEQLLVHSRECDCDFYRIAYWGVPGYSKQKTLYSMDRGVDFIILGPVYWAKITSPEVSEYAGKDDVWTLLAFDKHPTDRRPFRYVVAVYRSEEEGWKAQQFFNLDNKLEMAAELHRGQFI